MLEIVKYTDNSERRFSTTDPKKIRKALLNDEDWTDDMLFDTKDGDLFFISDLAGKLVKVGELEPFTVPDEY